jgi:hypothetical protein
MKDDRQLLEELNIEIGEAETRHNHTRLAAILAQELAFQRADPERTIDNRERFLNKVKEKAEAGAPQQERTTEVESIAFSGNRAIVSCIVSMDNGRYHNLRLFVKRDGQWYLLGWANEPL